MSDDRTQPPAAAAAQPVKLETLPEDGAKGQTLFDGNLQLIRNLRVKLTVSIGKSEISVGELFGLREGSVLKLDKGTDEPVELLLDGKVIAVGNLVVVGDNFGISITAITQSAKP
jgi:flagellar motor switch protein FliN/FliY